MQHALIISLFVAGFVGKALFDRYFGVRAASELVVRVLIFPFYAVQLLSTALLQAVLWVITGDPSHFEKKPLRRS